VILRNQADFDKNLRVCGGNICLTRQIFGNKSRISELPMHLNKRREITLPIAATPALEATDA
jgi:hypothetical protein